MSYLYGHNADTVEWDFIRKVRLPAMSTPLGVVFVQFYQHSLRLAVADCLTLNGQEEVPE